MCASCINAATIAATQYGRQGTVTTPVAPAAPSGSITLRYVELCKFRRLGKVQLDLDPQTTILVGANNSGKTAILENGLK